MSFTGKKYKQISKTRKVKCRVKTCQIILNKNSYPDYLKKQHPNENPQDRRTYGQKQLFSFCQGPLPSPASSCRSDEIHNRPSDEIESGQDDKIDRNQSEECEETEKGEGLETELEKSNDMEVGHSDENQPQIGDFRWVGKPRCRSRSPHGIGVTRNVYRATLDECTP